jgi:myo-inositol 2-dehydrogenase/D-chiro-inositol 1-dehydrogenase
MNVLILGDGLEERAWGAWFFSHSEYHLAALYPGLPGNVFPNVAVASDLDGALAMAGIDLVVVGGPPEFRGEALRRAAAEGLAIICLHPPGPDSEAYYQVAMSRLETGAVVVPDLPLRLHSGVARISKALLEAELGSFRSLRHEGPVDLPGSDLARVGFSRMIDVVRAILGEIETLTASGDPPGVEPDVELVVQLRAAEGRRAEVRIWSRSGDAEPSRLIGNGSEGSVTLEYDPSFRTPARLIRKGVNSSQEQVEELELWDPHEAIVRTLLASSAPREQLDAVTPSPNLSDGTRAMELSEAVVRSLRRGRTIDLHYEAISEESSFKSIMTSTGCLILLGILLLLPLALAGPALGINGTIYVAYVIPPLLILFVVVQFLRFGIRREGDRQPKRQG